MAAKRSCALSPPVLLAVLIIVVIVARLLDSDLTSEATSEVKSLTSGIAHIHWEILPVVAALAGGNYLGSSLSLRALAGRLDGRRVPMSDAFMTQFSGAAANRVAPAGLGTVGITCRYLIKRGAAGQEATAITAAMTLARGVVATATIGVLALVLAIRGAAVPRMLPRLPHVPLWWVIALVVAVLVVLGAAVWAARRWAVITFVTGTARALLRLRRRPADLAVALAGSFLCTASQTLAFAACVIAVPHGVSLGDTGALLLAYLLASAAGSAVPAPAGVGPTEAALTVALMALHVPAGHAVQSVALFRAMTYWAPVPVGVVCLRRLQRRGVLIGPLMRKGPACPTSPMPKQPS